MQFESIRDKNYERIVSLLLMRLKNGMIGRGKKAIGCGDDRMMTDCMLRGDCCDDAAPLLRCQEGSPFFWLLCYLRHADHLPPAGSNS